MNVTCPECTTVYRVDPLKIPAGGVRARCARCPAEFPVAEILEVGAVHAGASDSVPSSGPFGGADYDSPDTFADSFVGIEVVEGPIEVEVVDDATDGWGPVGDEVHVPGTGISDEGATAPDSLVAWSDQIGSDDRLEAEHDSTFDDSSADVDGSDQATRVEDNGHSHENAAVGEDSPAADGSVESSTGEIQPDADSVTDGVVYGSVEYVTGYTSEPAPSYDQNGVRDDSVVSPSAPGEDQWTSTPQDDAGWRSVETPAASEELDAAAAASYPEVAPYGEHPGHAAAETHAEDTASRDVADEGETQSTTVETGGATWSSGTSYSYPPVREASEEAPPEPPRSWTQDPEPAVPPVADASPVHDPRPVHPQCEEPVEVTRPAQAPHAAEMLESMQTPEGFSEVERQIPDADTPLPPAPFGSADPHSRAKRLARALVSDIVVYHPDRRERSIRMGTVRQEFRDEIRKSWDEYVSHVGNQMARETPYFREALNELLAGGTELF